MGGIGSGRPENHYRGRVDNCLTIDVYELLREGILREGRTGKSRWFVDGSLSGTMVVHSEYDWLDLLIDVGYGTFHQRVEMIWPSCNFGGERPCFLCPACGRRRIKLLIRHGELGCRQCHDVDYISQHKPTHYRALDRARELRERLGGSRQVGSPMPPRPKGMWRRTYRRLCGEIVRLEQESFRAALEWQLHWAHGR